MDTHPAGTRNFDARLLGARGGDPTTRAARLDELIPLGIGGPGETARRALDALDEWRRVSRLDGVALDARLATVGLSVDTLASLLAGRRAVRDAVPAWRRDLDEARDDASAGEDPPNVLFAGFVRPFAHLALRRVAGGPRAGLAASATARLAGIAGRVLLLELQRDRAAGGLRGEDARARFAAFSAQVAAPARRRRILDEYPALGRALACAAGQWAVAVNELLARYEADRAEVGAALFGAPLGPLAGVATHLSDPHRGGRTVACLVDDAGRRVLYKPRSLALDERFQSLLAWLEAAGLPCPHRRLRVVDRGAYGWNELVAPAPCADGGAVDRFYHRQGTLLALLHVLRGVDFHHENVIAAGEHPVLVDLEALFQHRPRPSSGDPLFETGLLPRRVFRGDGGAGIDLSGLGGPSGETVRMNGMLDAGLDTMRIGPRDVKVPGGHNRPVLDGRVRPAAESVEALVAGFRAAWQLFAGRREELQRRLEGFAGVEVRFFARPTQRYVVTLQEALHPDYLHDALDGELLLESLYADAGPLAPLVPSEQRDLRDADVPVFLARPGARHLWDSRGHRLDDVFARTSLEECAARIDALSDPACEEHVALVRRVLSSQ